MQGFLARLQRLVRNSIADFRGAYRNSSLALRDFELLNVSRKNFFAAIVCGMIGGVLSILQFGLLYKILNGLIRGNVANALNGVSGIWLRAILPESLLHHSLIWALLIVGLIAVRVAEVYISFQAEKFIHEATKTVQATLNNQIFSRSLEMSFSFFDYYSIRGHTSMTDVATLINARTEKYAEFLRDVFTFYNAIFNVALFLSVLLVVNPFLFLLALAVNPVARTLARKISRHIHEAIRTDRKNQQVSRSFVNSVFGGIFVVKTSNMENVEIQKFKEANEGYLEDLYESSRVELLSKPANEISSTLSFMTLAALTPFMNSLSAAGRISGTVIGILLVRQIDAELDRIKLASKKLADYTKIKTEIEVISGPETMNHYMKSGQESFKGLSREIVFNHLNFSYLPGRQILQDVSVKFPKGSVTAIVGHTGSGKSTVAKILLRLYDVPEASYLIDGKDVTACDLASVRNLFSAVSQEPVWFQESIKDNLIYGLNREVSTDELEEICQQVNMLHVIKKLPKGFETSLSAHSSALSGGEQQSLSLARALLRRAPVLILDEPTSSLDALSEYRIQELIEKLMIDKTVIMIAHRLSTIARAQHVLFMKEGRVAEQGTIGELVSARRGFYEFWDRQGAFWRQTLKDAA